MIDVKLVVMYTNTTRYCCSYFFRRNHMRYSLHRVTELFCVVPFLRNAVFGLRYMCVRCKSNHNRNINIFEFF
jgi:hypothetical protein